MRLNNLRLSLLFRAVFALLGLLLILIGVIAMIAPTPFGFVLVFLGLMLVAFAAPALVRWLRNRWRWFDTLVAKAARRAPRHIKKLLEKTEPRRDSRN